MNGRETLARRLIAVARQEGPRGLWWRALSATVYRRLVLVARQIDRAPPAPGARLAVDLEDLTVARVGHYLELRRDASAAEIERRLRTGQRCTIARHRGDIVSVRWSAVGTAEVPYLELAFELPPGVAYVYDVYTSPRARGRGIARQARLDVEDRLRRTGARVLLGTFMPENSAGRGLVAAAGYRPVGMIGCVRLPGARFPLRQVPPEYLGPARRLRPTREARRRA